MGRALDEVAVARKHTGFYGIYILCRTAACTRDETHSFGSNSTLNSGHQQPPNEKRPKLKQKR